MAAPRGRPAGLVPVYSVAGVDSTPARTSQYRPAMCQYTRAQAHACRQPLLVQQQQLELRAPPRIVCRQSSGRRALVAPLLARGLARRLPRGAARRRRRVAAVLHATLRLKQRVWVATLGFTLNHPL